VVENRAGAGSTIGTAACAKAAADGYTLVMAGSGSLAISPTLYKKLPYDPAKDFAPVKLAAYIPFMLVLHPSVPAHSVAELVSYAKSNPGKLSYASGGPGSPHHLYAELFKTLTGMEMVHVPYKGNAPALNDLLGGHVTMMFDIASTALPQVKAGKLKGLAVTSAKRSPDAPELPTMIEAGFPGFDVVAWYMLLAPANLPKDVLARLNSEANKALQTPAVRKTLAGLGFEIAGGTPEQADAFLRSEMKKWAEVVAATGIKAQ
jgi:tripartite-type tricarboxylate transporter receptor subunit TctC